MGSMDNVKSVIETKVIAAFGGAGGGAVVTSFLVWLLGVTVWGQSADAAKVADAVAAVPVPVTGLLGLVLASVGALVGGYLAPHTPRPDLTSTPDPLAATVQTDPSLSESHPQQVPSTGDATTSDTQTASPDRPYITGP